MRYAGAVAITAAGLLVAACGGSSGSGSQGTSTPTTTTTPATTAQSPPSTTASTQTTTTTTSAPALCRAAGLSLSFLGGQGATGHGELGFMLRNTSGQTCSTFGYPGVLFLDGAGKPLPTLPSHTTQDFFGSVPEAQVTLAPGATASFRLGVTHGAASPSGCTTAYGLQVIPPNDTASLRVAIADGAYECRTATVSPVARGTSAYS